MAAANSPYIIAEAGFNHDGDPQRAVEMVQRAAEAGADCIKFQLFDRAQLLSTEIAPKIHQIFADHQLQPGDYLKLEEAGKTCGIDVAASIFDCQTLDWYCENCSAPFIKIASGDISFPRLLKRARQSSLPVVLSTGGATPAEIKQALNWLGTTTRTVLLHCTPAYPTAEADLNLNRMIQLERDFSLASGFSDHSQSVTAPVIAAQLGAKIWERHVTPDPQLPGPEHSFSLSFKDFERVVQQIRQQLRITDSCLVKKIAGTGRTTSQSWETFRKQGRRSLSALRPLLPGDKISPENIIELRPGSGLPAEQLSEWIGYQVTRPVNPGQLIKQSMLTKIN